MADEIVTTARSGLIEHRIGAGGSVQITTFSGDLDVRATDGEIVRITARDPDDAYVLDDFAVDATDGSLSVRSPRGGFIGVDIGPLKWGRRIGGRGGTDLLVEVPHGARVELATVSGDIHATGLTGEQRYRTISGDLVLDGLSGSIDLDSTSGDVRLRSTGAAELRLRTVSGDVAVRAGVVDLLQLQTMSGDMRIEGALAPGRDHAIETVSGDARLMTGSGVTIEARTVSGSIRSDVQHRTAVEAGRRVIVLGDGRARLAYRSMSGDLQLTGKGPGLPSGDATTWRGELGAPAPVPPIAPARPPAPVHQSHTGHASPAGHAGHPEATVPTAPTASVDPPLADPLDAARLEILRALQTGEIDVATAGGRLAALDEPTADEAGTS